ncbi:MAG: glycosyltransferase [Candidatus Marinimicrobia bacterium]|nr:glycosyltransferase [Candidatus Neomarinimicrobiota bacterium]
MGNYKRKMVWFSEIRWDFMMTRKQQILKRFPKYWKILFIEPVVLDKKPHFIPKRENNIYIVTIPYLRGSNKKLLSKFIYNRIVSVFIKIFGEFTALFWIYILGFSGRDRVVALSSIHWGDFASRLKAKVKFYDCNDDHLKFAENCPWAQKFLKKYLSTCNFMTYVSEELNEKIQRVFRIKSYLVSNGVDFEHFSKRREPPEQIRNFKKPIIGYAGTIDYIDYSLLQDLSRVYENCSIILIGPEIRGSFLKNYIIERKLKNVHYLGRVDYHLLPCYTQSFDVAVIPFKKDEISKSLNPNKLYEYLAAGLKVVTMDFSKRIRELKGIIYVAKTKDEFVRLVGKAIKAELPPKSLEIAKKNDWREISERLCQIIEEHLNRYDNKEYS